MMDLSEGDSHQNWSFGEINQNQGYYLTNDFLCGWSCVCRWVLHQKKNNGFSSEKHFANRIGSCKEITGTTLGARFELEMERPGKYERISPRLAWNKKSLICAFKSMRNLYFVIGRGVSSLPRVCGSFFPNDWKIFLFLTWQELWQFLKIRSSESFGFSIYEFSQSISFE